MLMKQTEPHQMLKRTNEMTAKSTMIEFTPNSNDIQRGTMYQTILSSNCYFKTGYYQWRLVNKIIVYFPAYPLDFPPSHEVANPRPLDVRTNTRHNCTNRIETISKEEPQPDLPPESHDVSQPCNKWSRVVVPICLADYPDILTCIRITFFW